MDHIIVFVVLQFLRVGCVSFENVTGVVHLQVQEVLGLVLHDHRVVLTVDALVLTFDHGVGWVR